MKIQAATNAREWDTFLLNQQFSPFLQSWTMGEVYGAAGQEPVRLALRDGDALQGICQAIVVSARRGKHLSIPYGPVLDVKANFTLHTSHFINALKDIGHKHGCAFLRVSPFWPQGSELTIEGSLSSPLHLLAEHLWMIDLRGKSEEDILKGMRKNTRNLIRRAEKEGVTVRASQKPMDELHHFFTLYEETRRRHGFVPYTDAFIAAQVEQFSQRDECTLYLAEYQDTVIASSVHMHTGGETSYHHGASTHAHPKIPASYLLQWTAICDALKRGDHLYNFWGIAPVAQMENGKWKMENGSKRHPFAGVTTFKMGFGGDLTELVHCFDVPITKKYYLTRGFEYLRKLKRGF